MTESHAMSIVNILSGIKNKPAPAKSTDPQIKTARYVSTRKKKTP